MSKRSRPSFVQARKTETHFARQLRKVARVIGEIVNGFPVGDMSFVPTITEALDRYSRIIRPWAESVASRMLGEVLTRNEADWRALSKSMGVALQDEIRTAPTGKALRELMTAQADLITSLPRDAALRVSRLAIQGLENASRGDEIKAEIMRSGQVSASRANLIARTETARAASVLTQVRAEHIGSVGYVWRTARDGDVRPSHKAMEGKVVNWSDPPTLDGMQGHAGCLPNCRCYAEVIIPAP